uniref:Uncharacterized protein n=1 Tax=viral metagenome TaxID=1070528 RepID=A0A6C0ELP8_9ZZZZ
MSFCSVKIVKKFKIIKKSTNITLNSSNDINRDTSLDIKKLLMGKDKAPIKEKPINNQTVELIVRKIDNPDTEKQFDLYKELEVGPGKSPEVAPDVDPEKNLEVEPEVDPEKNPEVDTDSIPDDHYIGLIFIRGYCINKENIPKSKKTIFINKTQIYAKLGSIPIIKLDQDLISENFKYKKHIRKIANDEYLIKNKYISSIKLFQTYGNYHIYGIIVNNTKSLSNGLTINNSDNLDYSWDTILDFYYKEKENLEPTQAEIYTNLNNSKHINRAYKNIDPNLPDYINNYTIYYKHILEMLKGVEQ